MTNRTIRNICILMCLIVNAVLGATAFSFYTKYNYSFLLTSSIVLFTISLLIALVLEIYISIYRKGLRNFIEAEKIIGSVEQNLISLNAYYSKSDNNIYSLPKIKVDLTKNELSIGIDNMKIRKAIESCKDELSSSLPSSFIVNEYFVSENGNNFIIRFENINVDKQQTYKSLKEYLKHIDTIKDYSFEIDNKHSVALLDYPHWLIAGSTGSGKSFLTQLLLIQFISKKYDISVYDVKKSYSAFEDYVDRYETEPTKILEMLQEEANIMRQRQELLSSYLKNDPRALAVNYGQRQKIVIVEEYIGLKTLLNKDENKALDQVIKELSVLARSVNISLFIVAQSSSVDLIDSSIKNNLNKIFLGPLSSNIKVSTFGNGVDVPLFTETKKGYGYVQFDRIEQIKVPNVMYSVDELKTIRSADQQRH